MAHVLEAGTESGGIGNQFDRGAGAHRPDDTLGQFTDLDRVVVAHIDHLPQGLGTSHQSEDRLDRIGHVAEAARLAAIAMDSPVPAWLAKAMANSGIQLIMGESLRCDS